MVTATVIWSVISLIYGGYGCLYLMLDPGKSSGGGDN
jgi:hypothetical protein